MIVPLLVSPDRTSKSSQCCLIQTTLYDHCGYFRLLSAQQSNIPGVTIEEAADDEKSTTIASNEAVKTNETTKRLSDGNVAFDDDFIQPEGRILYRGSQLWKILVDTEEKAELLAGLRDGEGT